MMDHDYIREALVGVGPRHKHDKVPEAIMRICWHVMKLTTLVNAQQKQIDRLKRKLRKGA